MTAKPKDINEVLDDLAHTVAKTAKGPETPFEEKLDAFKALTAYAALRHKMRLKGDDLDQDGESTMDDLRNAISGAGERHNGRRPS
jgi:hypothetical protein